MRNLFYHVGQNIIKHRLKTLLSVTVSVVLCIFLMLFTGNMSTIQQKLKDLPKELEVSIDITNIAGANKTGLTIPPELINKVIESGLVEVKSITSRAFHIDPDTDSFSPHEMPGKNNLVAGITGEYSLEKAENQEIEYMKGYNETIFESEEAVALIRKEYMEEMGLSLGDTVDLLLFSVQGRGRDDNFESVYSVFGMGEHSVKIVGTFLSYGDKMETMQKADGNTIFFDYVISYSAMSRFMEEGGRRMYPTSASFTPKNPYNLNKIKEMLEEAGIAQVSSMNTNTAGFYGQNAVITDDSFISTAEPLQRRLSLLQAVYPFCIGAVALISFLAAYLLTQSRLLEMALFRSLGMSRASVFFMMWTEGLVLSGIGALIGFLLAALVIPGSMGAILIAALIYFGAYLIGSASAVIISNRVEVLTILTDTK